MWVTVEPHRDGQHDVASLDGQSLTPIVANELA